jgi:hypothetical protein
VGAGAVAGGLAGAAGPFGGAVSCFFFWSVSLFWSVSGALICASIIVEAGFAFSGSGAPFAVPAIA